MKPSKVFLQIAIACTVLCCATILLGRQSTHDSIDGKWTVTFTIQGQTVSGEMSFQAHGEKLDGKVTTEHTGEGTLNGGAWSHNMLSGIYVFEKHEAIAIAGESKDGKLRGAFSTEGRDGTWEAVRAASQP